MTDKKKQSYGLLRIFGILSVIFFALFVLFALFQGRDEEIVDLPAENMEETELRVLSDLKPPSAEKDATTASLQFSYRKVGTSVHVSAAAAGVYPSRTITSDELGRVPISFFKKFDSEIELFVRQIEGKKIGAFWGQWEFKLAQKEFLLKPAAGIRVEVLAEGEQNFEGKMVRLGRSTVSLLWIESKIDEDGVAYFEGIPEGVYAISTSLGTTRLETSLMHSGREESSAVLEFVPSFEIEGRVITHKGKAIPDVSLESYGEKSDLPYDIIRTNLFGAFKIESKTKAGFFIVRHPNFITQRVPFSLEEKLEIKLDAGEEIQVKVIDESKNPVVGASVSWGHTNSPDQIGGARISDDAGNSKFSNVPKGAVFMAFLGGYQSEETQVQQGRVELTLRNAATMSKRIRFRIDKPKGVSIEEVQAETGGVRCKIVSVSERDFHLSGCPEGEAKLQIFTSHGKIETTIILKDGVEIRLGSPTSLSIQLKGLRTEKWRQTKVELLTQGDSLRTQKLSIDLLADDIAEWKGELYANRYTIRVQNFRIGELSFDLSTQEKTVFSYQLEAPERKQFWVVDMQGAPITNAYIMLWKNNELVDIALSSGKLPTEFRRLDFKAYELLVIDPRRGENGGRIGTLDTPIVLSKKVDSVSLPSLRVNHNRLKTELGIRFVEGDNGHLIDVDEGGLGDSLGLLDNDLWVIAYFDSTGRIQLIIQRNNKYKVLSFETTLAP